MSWRKARPSAQDASPSGPGPPDLRLAILEAALAYAALAALWILTSDAALAFLVRDPEQLMLASALKGWIFVALTSLLFHATLTRFVARARPGVAPTRRWTTHVPAFLAAVAIVLAGGTAASLSYRRASAKQVEHMAAIAALKASHVREWLDEREANAVFLMSSAALATLHHAWASQGDDASREALRQRLEDYRVMHRFAQILLVDRDGKVELSVGDDSTPIATASLASAVRSAGELKWSVAASAEAGGNIARLDILAPLPYQGLAEAVIVVRVDPGARLLSLLRQWPQSGRGGEVFLLRRAGDGYLSLGAPEGSADALGTTPWDEALEAGVRRVGVGGRTLDLVVRRVPGTDWLVAAGMDPGELYGGALHDAFWIALAAALGVAATATGIFVFRERHLLALSALREREQAQRLAALEVLHGIAETSTDAIFAKDLEGRYLFVSREACRLVAKTAAEVIGRRDVDLFPAGQAAAIQVQDEAVARRGGVTTAEEQLATALGEGTFLVTRGPLRDQHRTIVGTFGIARDVSERKRAREALEREQSRLASILETMAEGFVFMDADGRYSMANAASEAILGVSRDRIVGTRYDQAPWRRVAEDGPPGPHPFVRLAAGEDEVRDLRLAIVTPEGQRRSIALNARALRSPDGRLVGVISTFEDITARRRAEVALQRSELHFRNLFAVLTEAILEFDPQARAMACNASAERLFGMKLDELRDPRSRRAAWRIVREDGTEVPEAELPLSRALATGLPQHGVLLGIHRTDGSLHWVLANVEPILDASGEVASAAASFTDVTERQHITEELARHRHHLAELVEERTAQLEQSLAKLESFGYTISHDLRAPLRAIIGYSSILRDELGASLSQDHHRMLEKLAAAAARMNVMLEEIHAYSRADRIEPRHERTDLAEVAREVIADLAPAHPGAEIVIGELPVVEADATMMRQVLQNLIGNALKFSAHAAHPRVEVGSENRDGRTTIFVRDNGVGFDMSHTGKLFGLFQRLHGQDEFSGTGVGLAIVKRIVERHGGHVAAESAPRAGATFRFSLGESGRGTAN